MTRDRKFLIAAGAALIALLIAIGSFSLGVYVGIYGLQSDAPRVAGSGGAPARAAQPALVPADPQARPLDAPAAQPAPAGPVEPRTISPTAPRPQIVGRVRDISGDTLTLVTAQGPRLVHLVPGIDIARAIAGAGEVEAALEEVQPGARVAVLVRIRGDGDLAGLRIILLP